MAQGIYCIGIDPGASGGVAIIHTDTDGERVKVHPMPTTERDVWDIFIPYIGTPTTAVIEKVTGYVGDGGNPGSRMFQFGASYGGLRMALVAACIPFEEIAPVTWQKALSVQPRQCVEKSVFKNRLKSLAQQLFPTTHVTLKTSDALLIAEYCRRRYHASHQNPAATANGN